MEKRKDGLAPFSSDECPNSGDDSDEDVITDYLTGQSECQLNAPIINGDLVTESVNFTTKDNGNCLRMSDSSDALMGHQSGQSQIVNSPNPLVPIISVTPHSPGIGKQYPVLEEPLRHLHEIHEKLYQMRDSTLHTIAKTSQNDHIQRLSTSCPTLCPIISIDGIIQTNHGDQDGGSDPDLLTNCSTNSSPTHYQSQTSHGIDRRRSWTDLEDSRHRRRSSGTQHLQPDNIKQRSISLSSLDDSDMDLELDSKARKREASHKNRTSVSQSSTHSLNEADFIKGELNKVVTKRSGQRLGEIVNLMPGVTGSRLPLQKSVSTPSIVTPPGQNHAEGGNRAVPSITANRHESQEKGVNSGSETETDDLHIPHGHEFPEEGTSNNQASLDELLTDVTPYDDQHSEKTRRKRGSLFFRKKKDKSGKKIFHQHQWSVLNTSGQVTTCDFCMKSTSNKTIIHCENCGAMVHQNQACKEQYQSECAKAKLTNKLVSKSISNVSSLSSTSLTKRASSASLPLPSSISSGNQTISEERDGDVASHRDFSSGIDDLDFDDGHQFSLEEVDTFYPELGLGREEPDSWSVVIGGRSVALKLVNNNEREIKRQEHIYEFVLTEKHHCLVLLAMERIFVEGLRRHFNFNSSILERMFPKLQDLIEIHFQFLTKLRQRQALSPVVDTIADILIDQFSCINANQMKKAYGEFCSQHRDAVDAYKQYQQLDPKFAKFVRHCQNNPLLKKKGIPECILFVTQRLTKYPLLIEPLIKTSVSKDETNDLRNALGLVKVILNQVNSCVDAKERTDRKLDIYHRIDAKSYATYRGDKFKKSDILASNRNLKFEGTASLLGRSGKTSTVVVVVLSDVLFFLAEARDHKYAFFVPDNRAGVVSLQKLIVREKAGQESRSIYLISSNTVEPEMFELKVQKPKDKQSWIREIQSAIATCPQDTDNENNLTLENNAANEFRDSRSLSLSKLTSEEKIRFAKETYLQNILDELRKKDEEQATLFEQKMQLHMRLQYALNISTGNDNNIDKLGKEYKEIPDNLKLLRGEGINSTQMWQEALEAVQEAMRLASSLSCSAGGGTLSRSLSSAGERHSGAYVPPALCIPRRAETFAGFDHNKERYPWRDSMALSSSGNTQTKNSPTSSENPEGKEEDELDAYGDQREVAFRLSHYVHTLLCIISNQMTTIESLQAQLATKDGSISRSSSSRPNPDRLFEELRNSHDQLTREKAEFLKTSQQERSQLDDERAELNKWRNQLTIEQRDIEKQRDQLYRKLEALNRQGVSLLAPTAGGTVPVVPHSIISGTASENSQSKKKLQNEDKSSAGIPQNLFSATNQQKVQQLPVKQQLPLKLASGSNNSNLRGSNPVNNNSPDRHSRTGSSPASVPTSTLSSPELGTNNKNGSLSHFSMSNRSLRNTRVPDPYLRNKQQSPTVQQQQQQAQRSEGQQPQQPLEEEVLFL